MPDDLKQSLEDLYAAGSCDLTGTQRVEYYGEKIRVSPTASGFNLLAWLGPAIGPTAFEVGADVLEAYQYAKIPFPEQSFVAIPGKPGK